MTSPGRKITIVYIDDHQPFHDAIRFLTEREGNIEVIASIENPADVFTILENENVNVVLTDLKFPAQRSNSMDGYELCSKIKTEHPDIRIVAYSYYDSKESVKKVFDAGVTGFVSKRSPFDELVNAINAIALGETYVCTHARRSGCTCEA